MKMTFILMRLQTPIFIVPITTTKNTVATIMTRMAIMKMKVIMTMIIVTLIAFTVFIETIDLIFIALLIGILSGIHIGIHIGTRLHGVGDSDIIIGMVIIGDSHLDGVIHFSIMDLDGVMDSIRHFTHRSSMALPVTIIGTTIM